MSDNNLNLSDESIGQIAKLIQMAILTGTDIVDNLRMLRLVCDGDSLYLSKDYQESFNANLDKMVEEVKESSTKAEDTELVQEVSTKIFS